MPPETQNNNENAENSENQNLNLSTTQNSNYNKKNVLIFAFILVIIGIYFSYRFLNTQMFPYSNQEAPQVIQERGEMLNWKTYRNEKYGFEFKYPQSFGLLEIVSPRSNAGQEVLASFESNGSGYNIYLNIYKLDKYKLYSAGSGMILSFDKNLDKWEVKYIVGTGPEYYDMDSFKSNGAVVYNYVWMDGGATSDIYMVPMKNSGLMIEIYYLSNDQSITYAKETLTTFKFISTSTPVQ